MGKYLRAIAIFGCVLLLATCWLFGPDTDHNSIPGIDPGNGEGPMGTKDIALTGVVTGGVTDPQNLNDENDATYDMVQIASGSDDATWLLTLDSTIKIDQIKVYAYRVANGVSNAYFKLEIHTNGEWQTIVEEETVGGVAEWFTYSTGWAAVDQIKLTGYVSAAPTKYCQLYFYTLNSFAEWNNSGLRVKIAAGNISIASQTLSAAHALRLRKSSGTVGIPLLEVTDDLASPLRIRAAGKTWALPKY